jgi:heat shock protein HtpX
MWEAIAANRRRSALLIVLMGVTLLTLGATIGMWVGSNLTPSWPEAFDYGTFDGETFDRVPGGDLLWFGVYGAVCAAVVWLVLWLIAVFQGDRVVLSSVSARQIDKKDSPRLWNIVEEMSLAAGLPQLPAVYLVEDPAPNAFAVGRNPRNASVAVTSGLLRLLDRDELQGVVAHEIGHIHNLDIRFMTLAAVLVGSVELISHAFLRVGPYATHGRRMGAHGPRSGGRAGALLIVAAVVAALSPLLIRLLYLACSRRREFLADASAARFSRYPEGLASALEKITVHHQGYRVAGFNNAVAPLCIVSPLEHLKLASFASTHPPTEVRVKILRSMGGGAGYVDYQAAWERIQGRAGRLAALEAAARGAEAVRARGASPGKPEDPVSDAVGRAREVADLIDRFANYLLIPCACGMRIKVPPDYRRDSVECPRCSRRNVLPRAESVPPGSGLAQAQAEVRSGPAWPDAQIAAGTEGAPPVATLPEGGPLRYVRRFAEWEAFRCPCGQTIQLGRDYPLDYTECAQCHRRIEISGKPAS